MNMQRKSNLVDCTAENCLTGMVPPRPETRNPKLETRSPKPETRDLKPETRTTANWHHALVFQEKNRF